MGHSLPLYLVYCSSFSILFKKRTVRHVLVWTMLGQRVWRMLQVLKYKGIYSHLQFCISSWGLAHANTLNLLEKMHKRIIRNMTNSSHLVHTTPLFFKLNLLNINNICNLEIAKYMFQINHATNLQDNQTFRLASHKLYANFTQDFRLKVAYSFLRNGLSLSKNLFFL